MRVLRYFNITKNIAQRLNYWKNGQKWHKTYWKNGQNDVYLHWKNGQIMIKRKITNKLQESGFTWTMNLCTSRFIS